MNKNAALMLAGIIFGLVAIAHLLRIYFAAEILVMGDILPMWVSWLGFVVAAILCILMFGARKSRS